MIYVYREWGGVGRVRIMDRTVETVAQRPYASLAELSGEYFKGAKITFTAPFEAVVLRNVFAYSVLHDFPKLFIPIPAVVGAWEE
jgi:hypothetical protein